MLRFVRGAAWDLFNDVTIQRFTSEAFAVSSDSDRMGVRLDGPELRRDNDVDLLSEAVAPGTIQVPSERKADFTFGRLPNHWRLSENRARDHGRSCGSLHNCAPAIMFVFPKFRWPMRTGSCLSGRAS